MGERKRQTEGEVLLVSQSPQAGAGCQWDLGETVWWGGGKRGERGEGLVLSKEGKVKAGGEAERNHLRHMSEREVSPNTCETKTTQTCLQFLFSKINSGVSEAA